MTPLSPSVAKIIANTKRINADFGKGISKNICFHGMRNVNVIKIIRIMVVIPPCIAINVGPCSVICLGKNTLPQLSSRPNRIRKYPATASQR